MTATFTNQPCARAPVRVCVCVCVPAFVLQSGGPIHGNTSVLLRGRGLRTLPTGEHPRCRFGRVQTEATLVSDYGSDGRAARCISPPFDAPGIVPLALSLNSDGDHSNDWTQPVRFVYHDVRVRSLRPVRGRAHQPDFDVHATGLHLAALAANISAYGAPMSELTTDELSTSSSSVRGASLQLPLAPLFAALEGLPLPIVPAAVEQQAAATPHSSSELLLAGSDCTMRVVRLSAAESASTSSDGAPTSEAIGGPVRAEELAGHGAVSLGIGLKAEGLTLCAPALGDLDGDGKADLILGSHTGELRAYRNLANNTHIIGHRAAPPEMAHYVSWDHHQQSDEGLGHSDNPLGRLASVVVHGTARPYLVDVDRDGDLDLFVACGGCGGGTRSIEFFRNLGTPRRAHLSRVGFADPLHPIAAAATLLVPIEDLSALNYTGTAAPLLPPAPSLAFGDINGDGWPEAILAGVVLHLVAATDPSSDATLPGADASEATASGNASDGSHIRSIGRSNDGSNDGDSLAHAVFGVPRLLSQYAPLNPLVDVSFAEYETMLIMDMDADGDRDVLSLGEISTSDLLSGRQLGHLPMYGAIPWDAKMAARDGPGEGNTRGVTSGVRLILSDAASELKRLLKCKFAGSFETRVCWSCSQQALGQPPPHQVPGQPHGYLPTSSGAGAVRCVPPPLDKWYPPRPRSYSGRFRVELSFDDQHWTQQHMQYEYMTPWRALSVSPTSGPAIGGTLVQVCAVATARLYLCAF